MDAILTTESLSIGYNRKPIVSGINLQLPGGCLTVLTGENGTGKSTLLKTFTKIIKPVSGEIFIQGREIGSIPSKEFSKMVAVVLTDRLSSENFTALEVISFGRSPYTGFFGRLSADDYSIIKGVAEEMKIEPLLPQNFYELSDGQKQKVLIAKALAQEAKLIILDEPTAFLDFKAKDEIFALLKRIAEQRNIAVLAASHDIYQAEHYANDFWIIDGDGIKNSRDVPWRVSTIKS
ncbi:MAG: ABC transporter ATP-binding protein [Bacteroidales bacterium]|nr:ABC transporter ATP-binding protein [Bacteroidales bacterium]